MTTSTPQFVSPSLYVGNLHKEVNEDFLLNFFQEVGPIVNVKIPCDRETRRSLGYAYVNFQNLEDAERALTTLNFTSIQGKAIRIMWSQRDPSQRKSGVGNVFIKNLDPSIDEKSLYDTFSTFGNIVSSAVKERVEKVQVKNEETGEMETKTVTKGFGFVHFETKQAADLAVAKMNGMLFNGKKVVVTPFKKKSERFNIRSSEKDFTNIYIKNLEPSVTTDELVELFEKYGKIQHASVATDHTGASRGFGFINYVEHDDAVRAMELNGTEHKGQTLFVSRFQSRAERDNDLKSQLENFKQNERNKWHGRNLYVKNLDDTFDDEKLKQEFAKYGKLSSVAIMRDERDQSRGFGFVCFETAEDATRALTDMNGKMIGSKPLYVALAQKKEDRRAHLAAQHRQGGPMGGPMMPGFPIYPQAPFFQGGFPPHMMRPRWAGPGGRGAPFPVQPAGPGAFGPGNIRGRGGARGGARGGRNSKVHYNQNVRNQRPLEESGAQTQALLPSHHHMPETVVPEQGRLTLSNLSNLPHEEQKRVLGEQLFPRVSKTHEEDAGKITGMLLELDNALLLELLESPAALDEKVEEAVSVLKEHEAATAQSEEVAQE